MAHLCDVLLPAAVDERDIHLAYPSRDCRLTELLATTSTAAGTAPSRRFQLRVQSWQRRWPRAQQARFKGQNTIHRRRRLPWAVDLSRNTQNHRTQQQKGQTVEIPHKSAIKLKTSQSTRETKPRSWLRSYLRLGESAVLRDTRHDPRQVVCEQRRRE